MSTHLETMASSSSSQDAEIMDKVTSEPKSTSDDDPAALKEDSSNKEQVAEELVQDNQETTTANLEAPPIAPKEDESLKTDEAESPKKNWSANLGQSFRNCKQRRSQQSQDRLQEIENKAQTTTLTTTEETVTTSATTTDDPDYTSIRASQISILVKRESVEGKWGIGLEQQADGVVTIGAVGEQGILRENESLRVGDILKSVNNQRCVDETATKQLLQELVGDDIILQFEIPAGHPNIVQAQICKPLVESLVGIGFLNSQSGGQQLLYINHIAPRGLLAHSCLNQGDLVLVIQGIPCANMDGLEAANLIKNLPDTVTIVAMRPPPATRQDDGTATGRTWLGHAKRAGVAVGGGLAVGVGLVFIPTLPPPFGEILIAGGVAFLGTEFEAPKRVMRSARDSLKTAVGPAPNDQGIDKVEEQGNTEENKEIIERGETPDAEGATVAGEAQDDPAPGAIVDASLELNSGEETSVKRKTMKDRFKNFARNHVVPFLDQVVGDKPEEETASPAESEETKNQETHEGTAPPTETEENNQETLPEESVNAEENEKESHATTTANQDDQGAYLQPNENEPIVEQTWVDVANETTEPSDKLEETKEP
jgi:hypothetical protein